MSDYRRCGEYFFSCLDALAACNYLPQSREKIIAALFKALNSTNNELQEAGEACMRKVGVALFSLHCRCYLTFMGQYISKLIANYMETYGNTEARSGFYFLFKHMSFF